ncbi:phosphate acetyltransferase [Ornithinimicrobium cavernae]|uniref:phosphate acetyltransferase n=1 Tax=Ornithinimicrobium cavernae TaxID=2666047 RepID=UPI000D6864A9|nr:phosphate acetyltransferase [Ornithinimicrobium cavernae]
MTTSLYLASAESRSGKSAVALGILEQLTRLGGRVGVFRPIVQADVADPLLHLLLPRASSPLGADEAVGVTYDRVHVDAETAVGEVVDRFHAYAASHDTVLVIGSDFTDIPGPTEFSVNATIAANIGAPMLLVVPALNREPEDAVTAAALTVHEARTRHADVLAVIVNRVAEEHVATMHQALADTLPDHAAYVLPANPVLAAPTVRDLMLAIEGEMLLGDEALLDQEAMSLIVAGMRMPNVLDRLREGAVVICPADREEVLLASLQAHRASTFPGLSGIILNGGFPLSPQVRRLVDGLDVQLPVVTTRHGTFTTATLSHGARPRIQPGSHRKIEEAIGVVEQHLDLAALLPHAATRASGIVTPLMFEHRLTEWAREVDATVVLPEGLEERILRAADQLLTRGVARLILLGREDEVRSRAAELGLRIDSATVVDPQTDSRRQTYARRYAELRAHKGVTLDQALDTLTDPSYFGTLMVLAGDADGMVSGSVNTTAHTIRPALEVVRTVEGVSVVSSVFFMCLADQVLVYGDCAINPDPTAEQLADIAVSSARTAAQFGVDPRVAMLSYSTGGSGTGADVDKVRRATELVRELAPGLSVEGPIQYDAAVDAAVAATKLKDSPVAGRATVLIFPDLNTGNNTYKAVQRSAQAVAVGPVLQGLRRPVNDLSRGATVRDIVNTVAITAVQAREAR